MPRFTPPRRIADVHDTHVSRNEIMKTFLVEAREIGGSGPANVGRGATPAPVVPASFSAIQRVAGGTRCALTASASAVMRARIAVFEPTSASDDAMIR